ncbi:MAG: hypothetical protein LBQ89_01280 [Treponema sp.]|nr:hypothetical protein [Treponema sp.]
MANKKFWLGMLVIVLVFGMTVFCCDDGGVDTHSYTEGDVNVEGVLMHYYFSKTPEGIEKAAFDNGISSINPPIKNAMWTLNPSLDINVKNAMDSRGATYSGTVYIEGGVTYIYVNRKNSGSWYSALYTIT